MRWIISVLCIFFLMPTVSLADDITDQLIQKIQKLEQRVDALEEALAANVVKNVLSRLNEADTVKQSEQMPLVPLRLTNWAVERHNASFSEDPYLKITMSFENIGDKIVEVVAGSVKFDDKLGQLITRLPLEKDMKLAPSAVYQQQLILPKRHLKRLYSINRDFVEPKLEIRQILYADGTIGKF